MFLVDPFKFSAPAVNNSMVSTITWVGNGSTQSITGVGFQPDLVIIRPLANQNARWIDSTRGGTKILEPDSSQTAEITDANAIQNFTSDGFDLGSSSRINASGTVYFALCFKKDAGLFDIVTRTGDATNGTVNHALSGTPEMIVAVNLTDAATADWPVYHVGMDASAPETYYMFANQTTARSTTLATYWNDTAPTSSNFAIGTNNAVNGSGDSMIYYVWKGNADYAKFGSYTGVGGFTGPTVTTTFEPYVLLIKGVATSDWRMASRGLHFSDTPVQTYKMDDAGSASGATDIQFNSTTFQIKNPDSAFNQNTTIYVYAAFRPRNQAGYFKQNGAAITSNNFQVPSAVSNIKQILLIGPGGQGQTSTTSAGGYGGGGGAKVEKANYTVTPGGTVPISVGGVNSTVDAVFGTLTAGHGASGALGGAAGLASGGDTNTDGEAGSPNSGTTGGDGGDSGSGALGGAGGIGGNAGTQGANSGGGGGGGGTDGVSTFVGGNGRPGTLETMW